MVAGRMKIPEPITLPITREVADQRPMLFLRDWGIVIILS
jgi:hypothetical protein